MPRPSGDDGRDRHGKQDTGSAAGPDRGNGRPSEEASETPAPTTRRRKAVPLTDPEILRLLDESLGAFVKSSRRRLRVEFYPYAGLKHTIRLDRGCYYLRLSDLLLGAPGKVIVAAGIIMFARITQRPCPRWADEIYESFAASPEVRDRMDRAARARGWRFVRGTRGKHRDLDDRFGRINREYFGGKLSRPRLTWSVGKSRRKLGQYDETFDLIAINRKLDSRWVPLYVLDYVLFHEMLHIIFPAELKNGRRMVHTREFNKAEKKFKDYDRAIRWLEK